MTRIGVIGCGRIAKRHLELLGNGAIAGARLAAVCDVDEARAKAAGLRFGVPFSLSIEDLLREREVEAVAILTPSGLHARHAIAAAESGRHVIVEKPMALRLQDADRMIEAAERAGVRLFVVKQNRFNVPVVKAREALDAGRFGKLVLGTVRVRWCRDQAYYDNDDWRGTWPLDGGVLSNQASHHIDMLQWFMGDVKSVHARAATALVNIEAEDCAVATVEFTNGALGVIEATTAVRPKDLEGSLSILGSKGSVEIAGFAVNAVRTWQFTEPTSSDSEIPTRYSVNPPNVYGFGHQAFYEHVIDCLKTGQPALIEGKDGRKSLELILALYESIETGKAVTLGKSSYECRLGHAPTAVLRQVV